jgi:hypothetical protein
MESLNWKDFIKIEHQIIDAFFEKISTSKNQTESSLIKIGFRCILDISNLILFDNLSHEDKKAMLRITDNNESPNYIPQINYEQEFIKATKGNFFLKWVKSFVALNSKRKIFLLIKPRYVAMESNNLELLKEQNSFGLLIPYSYSNKIKKHRNKTKTVPEKNEKETLINKITDDVLSIIIQKLSKTNPSIKLSKRNIHFLIKQHLESFYNDYILLSNRAKLPKYIVIGTNNKTYLRLINQLILERKGSVIAYTHGHRLQNNDDHKLWMDLITSSIYREYNIQMASELKEILLNHEYAKIFKSEVVALPVKTTKTQTSTKYKLTNQSSNSVPKMILVGNATKLTNFSSVTAFLPTVQFEIESNILQYYHRAGYKVFYKPHPGGQIVERYRNLINSLGFVGFEDGKFEDVFPKYDLICFYYTRTTTINAMLKANIPFVFIDVGIDLLCLESYKILLENATIISYSSILEGL